jgi:hypothetical protein
VRCVSLFACVLALLYLCGRSCLLSSCSSMTIARKTHEPSIMLAKRPQTAIGSEGQLTERRLTLFLKPHPSAPWPAGPPKPLPTHPQTFTRSSCQPMTASTSSMLCIGAVSQTLVVCISSLAPALPVARRPSAFQILMVRCFFR